MTDDLLARLRDLDRARTDLPVDHAAVLRRGHRRRAARTAGVTTLSAAVVAGTVVGASVVAGDGGSTVTPASAAGAGTATADVDLTTGAMTLPLDAWTGTSHDRAVMATAADLFTYRCVQAAGYGTWVVFPGPSETTPDLDAFGVWDRTQAERTGYGSLAATEPRSIPLLAADAPAAAVDARRSCFAQATDEGYSWDLDALPDAPTGWTQPEATAAGRSAKAAWAACLETHGVSAPAADGGWVPDGATELPLADQVRVARVDLDCKESLGTLQKLADAEARSQTEYIARAGDYLRVYRATVEPVLAQDRAYLADAGLTVGG